MDADPDPSGFPPHPGHPDGAEAPWVASDPGEGSAARAADTPDDTPGDTPIPTGRVSPRVRALAAIICAAGACVIAWGLLDELEASRFEPEPPPAAVPTTAPTTATTTVTTPTTPPTSPTTAGESTTDPTSAPTTEPDSSSTSEATTTTVEAD